MTSGNGRCRLINWAPDPPPLAGLATVAISGGLIVAEIPVLQKKGRLVVGVQRCPEFSCRGHICLDAAAQRIDRPLIEDHGASARWNNSILVALAASGISPAEEATP
jgi:hypothetical protein